MLTRDQYEAWLAALESGEYDRAKGLLTYHPTDSTGRAAYCCLGVLCVAVLGLDRAALGAMDGTVDAPPELVEAIPDIDVRVDMAFANDSATEAEGFGPAILTVRHWAEKVGLEQARARCSRLLS